MAYTFIRRWYANCKQACLHTQSDREAADQYASPRFMKGVDSSMCMRLNSVKSDTLSAEMHHELPRGFDVAMYVGRKFHMSRVSSQQRSSLRVQLGRNPTISCCFWFQRSMQHGFRLCSDVWDLLSRGPRVHAAPTDSIDEREFKSYAIIQ